MAAPRSEWRPSRLPPSPSHLLSCRVRRVLVDILGGEICRLDSGYVVTRGQIDGDGDLAWPQVHCRPIGAGRASLADPDTVDRDAELIGLECCCGGADGREDPAPVRVFAMDRALQQIAAGD